MNAPPSSNPVPHPGAPGAVPRPTLPRRLAGWLRRNPHAAWPAFIVTAVLLFTALVVRPFGVPTADPQPEDVSTAWNASISRLGILPVYPPEEDFHVGDVWAVVAESDEKPILGQAVRLGHIDLRADIATARGGEPVFAETPEGGKAGFRPSQPLEAGRLDPADDRIALTLAAFPGITITHSVRATAGLASGLAGFNASRGAAETEEITIPVAETYGVRASRAFARLDQWCADEDTRLFCTDEYARRVLTYAVNSQVLRVKAGEYASKLQLRLITRVFVTREIRHKRVWADGQGVAASASATPRDPAAKPDIPPADPRARTPTTSPDLPSASNPAPLGSPLGSPGGAIGFDRADGVNMQLTQVFQRPVVFGYRAITITIDPSKPTKVKAP